ncbi:MAG: hypothetical protein A3K66_03345 [Euryarchaeota archaeon RBG_16_67_27]|nr:MAG: hypothetical protein A3K66_03345 [Euryarchaeota archaeon RBG_16_67_27]
MVLFTEDPIRALQQFSSPWLDIAFIAITQLGSRHVLFILSMLVAYVVNKRAGFLVALAVLSSAALNGVLKTSFDMPRPSAELHKIPVSGAGFPSGHAQAAGTFFGTTASIFGRVWTPLALLFLSLVALSRVYLGVHFVGDVLGGVAIGLAVGAVWLLARRWNVGTRLSARSQLLVAFLAPTAAQIGIYLTVREVSTTIGLLTGVAVGWTLEPRFVDLAPPRGNRSVATRLLLGGVALTGLEIAGRSLDFAPAEYGFEILVGLIATIGIPWLFVRVETRPGFTVPDP